MTVTTFVRITTYQLQSRELTSNTTNEERMSRLSRESILQGMADALPTHPKGDESSDLASSYEAIALLVHAYLAAIGFRLQGFDEDKKIRTHSSHPLTIAGSL
jgi:hypothetical protein